MKKHKIPIAEEKKAKRPGEWGDDQSTDYSKFTDDPLPYITVHYSNPEVGKGEGLAILRDSG